MSEYQILTVFLVICCHLIGDYALQSEYLAKTKKENWYHMFVHCMLYVVPFYMVFGMDWRLVVVWAVHLLIDILRTRFKASYFYEQFGLYVLLLILYLTE